MWKLLAILAVAQAVNCNPSPPLEQGSNRQKRLLFFDEQGSLVKTYANPHQYNLGYYEKDKNPFFFNYLNPFYSLLRPNTIASSVVYTIPVSDAVLKQLYMDPLYHNQLIVLPTRKPVVEASPLCSGKRTQIPSPNLCSNFLNCWDGWAWEQECPAGLLFSNEGYCDYQYNVNCNQRYVKEEPKPLCNKEFEAFKNSDNCKEFFICVHKLPMKFQCPEDLAYNEELGVCDYPANVHCNMTLNVTTPAPQAIEVSTTASKDPSSSTTTPDKLMMSKTEFNSQSWKSVQVATSRQDAIKQLGQLPHIHTGY
ncbi:unnamed protein product [Pieris macdunnoughi]|uniref:Chitin-binding type-2 domain-containing protein n=1 Tax=Pieris macdunnoughi TaxID=345717 RepID=A0A821NDH1_9NEOP|nr:unnamed protein product [Pieris macdunnoughi]